MVGAEEENVRRWDIELLARCLYRSEGRVVSCHKLGRTVTKLICQFGSCIGRICRGDEGAKRECSECDNREIDIVGCEESYHVAGFDRIVMTYGGTQLL